MTTAIKAPAARGRENQPRELTEVELSHVTGGGSSGADAGKVTFNDRQGLSRALLEGGTGGMIE